MRVWRTGGGRRADLWAGGCRFWRCLCYAQIYDAAVKPQEQAELGRMVVVESEHLHADPGYLSTSRLVLEAGLCLALEVSPSPCTCQGRDSRPRWDSMLRQRLDPDKAYLLKCADMHPLCSLSHPLSSQTA